MKKIQKNKKKIIKVGDRIIIKNDYGIQYNQKKGIRRNGFLTGNVRAIYKNCIYKIQLDPLNYYFCKENDIVSL